MCNCNTEFMSKECLIKQIKSLINKIYNDQHRPFYSEMDFQYNLLLMLEKKKPEGWSIYTEVPYDDDNKSDNNKSKQENDNEEKHKRIDICVKDPSDNLYLLELKYKTQQEKYYNPFWGQTIDLKPFSCYTDNREAFFDDVKELKKLSEKNDKVKSAFAIFLTNCENYAKNGRKKKFLMGAEDKNNTCTLEIDENCIQKGKWYKVEYEHFIKASKNNTVYFNIVEIESGQ